MMKMWSVDFFVTIDHISGVMVSLLASSAVYRGLSHGRIKPKTICCFSAKHAALRRTSKDWLARNQNNVSEWSDMSTRGLLFQWASTIKFQLSVLVYSSTKRTSSSSYWKLTCSPHNIAKILLWPDLPLCLGVLKHKAPLARGHIFLPETPNIFTMDFCLCGAILNLKVFCFGAIPDMMI